MKPKQESTKKKVVTVCLKSTTSSKDWEILTNFFIQNAQSNSNHTQTRKCECARGYPDTRSATLGTASGLRCFMKIRTHINDHQRSSLLSI